ncbi:MAG: hypothetical protein DRR42_24025, partial [Gammaproteobacteria bacterium]
QASSLPSPATLTTEFIRGEGMGGGVGGMVYSIRGGTIIFSHANHRGDIIARSNLSGSLTSFALYEAYGTRPYEWGDDPDRQKANTKEEESDLNLLNEGMRWRDLEKGTFLTRDPLRYKDGPNMYCYVHCNPITRFDAFGLNADDITVTPATKNSPRTVTVSMRVAIMNQTGNISISSSETGTLVQNAVELASQEVGGITAKYDTKVEFNVATLGPEDISAMGDTDLSREAHADKHGYNLVTLQDKAQINEETGYEGYNQGPLKNDAHIGITDGGDKGINGKDTVRTFAHEVLLHGAGAGDDGTPGSIMESGGSGTALKSRAVSEVMNGPFSTPAGRQPGSVDQAGINREKSDAQFQRLTGESLPGMTSIADNEASINDILPAPEPEE